MGLGRFGGGVGVTRWLATQGAKVTVTDQSSAESLTESIQAVSNLDVALHLGGHDVADLDDADLVVVNPAVVKEKSAFFQQLIRKNVPWTTEMNLFCERCPAPVIGVTGSFGKSTTCALLAEALRAGARTRSAGARGVSGASQCHLMAFEKVHLGGNIGGSLLSELPTMGPADVVILEMSNAQLEDLPRIRWLPRIAVVTNLWPHHLDRYDTFANYISAKLNIVGGIRFGSGLATQGKHELGSCVPPESIIVGEMHEDARTQLRERAPQGWRWVRDRGPIELRVPGRHNLANANCVLEVCEALGLDEITARGALAAFAGLPHRLQYVGTLDGVDYFNDSKSTSPSATVMAVESFDRPVIALVGGQDKDVPLEDFAHALIRKCRVVIGVGESKHAFLRAIRENGQAHGKERQLPQLFSAQGLDQALDLARRAAKPGEIIVFSPGAPSFDGYTNYAQRGEHFMRIVGSLAKSASKGDGAIPADGAQNDEA